jgi:hypothetical protein
MRLTILEFLFERFSECERERCAAIASRCDPQRKE